MFPEQVVLGFHLWPPARRRPPISLCGLVLAAPQRLVHATAFVKAMKETSPEPMAVAQSHRS